MTPLIATLGGRLGDPTINIDTTNGPPFLVIVGVHSANATALGRLATAAEKPAAARLALLALAAFGTWRTLGLAEVSSDKWSSTGGPPLVELLDALPYGLFVTNHHDGFEKGSRVVRKVLRPHPDNLVVNDAELGMQSRWEALSRSANSPTSLRLKDPHLD